MPIVLAPQNSALTLDWSIQLHHHHDETSSIISSALEPSFPHQHQQQLKTKQVRFSASPHQYYENRSMCKEDLRNECWYSREELYLLRRDAIETAREIAAVERRNRAPFGYTRVLEQTFAACTTCTVQQQHPQPEEEDDDEEESANKVLSPVEAEHLQQWLEIATTRLGLERLSVLKISQERQKAKRGLARLLFVGKESKRIKFDNNNNDGGDSGDDTTTTRSTGGDDQHAEYLRDACRQWTRPNRLFARTMAENLAVVLRRRQQQQDCDEVKNGGYEC